MVDFARPEFLWALPAAAVPVLIHILNRRRYRRVPWAAMEHLVRAERQSRRRIQWQNLLVLLLRVSAVILLVLVFARPRSARPLSALMESGSRVVVLLDDSASMAQQEAGISAFDRAKDFTLAAARQVAGRDVAFAGYVASEGEPFFAASRLLAGDLDRVANELDGLRPGALVFEPGDALATLAAAAAAGAGKTAFLVLTDLRAADWGEHQLRPDARRGLEALQERGSVVIIDFGTPGTNNAGVTDVAGADQLAYAQSASVLQGVIQNDGADGLPASRMDVRLDGEALPPVATPAVPAGERREVPLEVYLESPGPHALEVALSDADSFPPDDRRFVALDAVREVPVLIAAGDARPDRPDGAAYYLRRALRPEHAAPVGIRPELSPAGLTRPDDLRRYAAVFLCNVRSPAAWQEPLARYVESGGRLVVFLGDQVDAEAWNATLFRAQDGLLPCRIETRFDLEPAEAAHLAELDVSDPLLAPFADWQTLFGLVRVTRFFSVQPLGDTKVLARLGDARSSPAILAGRAGRGSVVLFASSADDAWTDWPRSEAGRVTYVALMHRLVESAAAAGRPEVNLAGGSRIEYPLDPSRFRPEAMLRHAEGAGGPVTAGGATLRAGSIEHREGLWFVSEPLTRAGIWQLELTGEDGARQEALFAVNVPDRERLLARTDPAVVRAAAAGGMLTVLQFSDDLLESAFGGAIGGRRYWPALAAAAIVVLLLDSLLAWTFGRPGRPLDAGARRTGREP